MSTKYCANCKSLQKATRTTCYKCGMPLPDIVVKDNTTKFVVWFVFVVIGLWVLVAVLSSGNNSNWKARDAAAFDSQMQRSPSTWTREEQRRFDSFSNWLKDNP